MPYQETKVESFGGLNLDADPGDVGWGGAIDLLDVDFDRPGLLRERDRFSQLVTTALTSPSVVGAGHNYYIASTAASVALYSGGSLVGTAVAPNRYFNGSVQPIGTPSATYIYMADQQNVNAVRRLTTAGVISAPAGMPVCANLARTTTDNRLVAMNIATVPTGSTATASGSLVHFSDSGAPETWGANNYVYLDPGDGETIQGGATYGNSLYIFKPSKIYEFYGTSIDGTGNPIFNYRTFRHSTGSAGYPVAGPDGVYFLGYGGSGVKSVFRINEAGISEIGRPIRRALSNTPPSTFTPGALVSTLDMAFGAGQLRLLVTTLGGSSAYCFSYNPATDRWTLIQLADDVIYISSYGDGNQNFVVAGIGANAVIHYLNPSNTSTDSLRTPTGRYRSGFSDLGTADEKVIREWILQGTGSPTFKTCTDFGSLSTGNTVTLGTSPAVAEGRDRTSVKGRQFGWQVSGTSAWTLNNLVARTREKRSPGTDD